MRPTLGLASVMCSLVILCGCQSGINPSKELRPDALKVKELRGRSKIAVIPVAGEFNVWNQRGRIKARGVAGAGVIGAGIGGGAVLAAGTTTTAAGATVVAMTPAAAVATAGLAVAVVAIWIAGESIFRTAVDRGLEKALAKPLGFRPESIVCEGIESELSARYGIEVVEPGQPDDLDKCDVIVLVRTWNYGMFRVYTPHKKKQPLRPFEFVSVHVHKPSSLDSNTKTALIELAQAEPGAEISSAGKRLLKDRELWFGSRLGETAGAWCRFIICDQPLPTKKKELVVLAPKIRKQIAEAARALGERYGFHLALSMK